VRNLRIFLDAKSIRLRTPEIGNSNIQVTDVLFGPFNFPPNSLNAAMCFHVLGLVNQSHPPTAQLLDDAVVRDDFADDWAEY